MPLEIRPAEPAEPAELPDVAELCVAAYAPFLAGDGHYLSGQELTRTDSLIAARNHPDQCFGCEPTAARGAAPFSAQKGTQLRRRHTHTSALSRTPAR